MREKLQKKKSPINIYGEYLKLEYRLTVFDFQYTNLEIRTIHCYKDGLRRVLRQISCNVNGRDVCTERNENFTIVEKEFIELIKQNNE